MRKLILTGLAACSLLLMQSCSKKESLKGIKTMETNSSKLKVRDVYIDVATVPTGSYKITTGATINVTNKTMGVASSLTAGASVQQLDYTVNTGSDWRVTSLGNGYYSIINTFSGQALTLGDGSLPEHEQIIQYPYGAIDAQQWKIAWQGGFGIYRIESKLNILKGAHVDPFSTASGTNIKLETYPTGNANAGFFFLSAVAVTYQDQAATNFYKRTSGITATDGALGFALSDGRVFWSAGDSHYNDYSSGKVACLFNRRGVSWVQPSTTNWDWTQVTTLAGSTNNGFYIPPGAPFSWPTYGFQIGSTVYIYVLPNGSAAQPYMASVNTSTLAVTGYTALAPLTGMDFNNGFVKETDGYIYAFGHKAISPYPPYYLPQLMLRARIPQSNPTGAWTFYNGSAWVSDPAQATSTDTIATGAFGVCKINSKYIVTCSVSNLGCDAGTDIYAYSSISNSPLSAYKPHKVIYSIPDRLNGHSPFWYGAVPRPEFNLNNELLVFYSVNGYGNCAPACSGGFDPDVNYRCRGIRVPFSLIDPTL